MKSCRWVEAFYVKNLWKKIGEVRDAIFVCMHVDRLILLKEMYSFAENYFKIQQIVVSKKLLPIYA